MWDMQYGDYCNMHIATTHRNSGCSLTIAWVIDVQSWREKSDHDLCLILASYTLIAVRRLRKWNKCSWWIQPIVSRCRHLLLQLVGAGQPHLHVSRTVCMYALSFWHGLLDDADTWWAKPALYPHQDLMLIKGFSLLTPPPLHLIHANPSEYVARDYHTLILGPGSATDSYFGCTTWKEKSKGKDQFCPVYSRIVPDCPRPNDKVVVSSMGGSTSVALWMADGDGSSHLHARRDVGNTQGQ
jgi:hypothetical protein